MNKTLQLFYGEKHFKPVYSSIEHEIGDEARVSVNNGKDVVKVHLISQEEMSQEQADLFFYLWSMRNSKASFESNIKYAIRCSVEVIKYDDAAEVLSSLQEADRQRRIARENASFRRAYNRISRFLATM